MLRILALTILTCCSVGCSSLGLSLYPTGHHLTDQAEAVLNQSPNEVDLPKELSKDVLPVHFLEPGDVLLIEPVDFESDVRIPADQHVLADGSVDLGAFGRAVVAGLSLEDAEDLIEQRIVVGGGDQTQVNLRLLEASHRYYVLGEVNSPGSYPLKGHETVLDGIVAAGGLTGDASPCKLLLARPTEDRSCRITLPVCYREITQLGDGSTNYQLRPGDRIFVASRSTCEELMCWLSTQTCERCCKCQTACRNPAWIPFRNVYTRVADDRTDSIWHSRAGHPVVKPTPPNDVQVQTAPSRKTGPLKPPVVERLDLDRARSQMSDQLDGRLPTTDSPPQIPQSLDQSDF